MFITIEQRIAAGSQFTGTNGGSGGTITTVAGSLLLHGETFQVRSRAQAAFTFVFDKSTDVIGVTETARVRRVVVSDAMTAAQVRDAIIFAINRAPGLALYASNGGATTVTLLNAIGGTAGNLPALPDTVANAGFIVSALTSGTNLPSSPIDSEGIRFLPEATFGGIFDFDFTVKKLVDNSPTSKPALWKIDRILLQVTGAATYTLSAVLPDGISATIQTGAGGVILISSPIVLGGDERLRLVTTGAAAAMLARVTARPSA